MLASELVVKLSDMIKEHGDLHCTVWDECGFSDVAAILINLTEEGQPANFALCDQETSDMCADDGEDDDGLEGNRS